MMKNLRLKSMLLVSHTERRARKFTFHPAVNVFKGANTTGKSSAIKSILRGFGGEVENIKTKWKNMDVVVLIHFQVASKGYSILRKRNRFSLFDAAGHKVGSYDSVTNELSPELAKILEFRLKLADRKQNARVLTPAFYFLPFYIDQDAGWQKPWNSLGRLGQFPNQWDRVASYHVGLRPERWYELDAQKYELEQSLKEPSTQLATYEKLKRRGLEQLSSVDFDIDFDRFKKEIERLLVECERLKLLERKYKNQLTELERNRLWLQAQIEITAFTHDELSNDYKYANNLSDREVECPTCGVVHEDSFEERFSIGFYPVLADTFKKPDTGPKECLCRSVGSSVESSSKGLWSRPISRV